MLLVTYRLHLALRGIVPSDLTKRGVTQIKNENPTPDDRMKKWTSSMFFGSKTSSLVSTGLYA